MVANRRLTINLRLTQMFYTRKLNASTRACLLRYYIISVIYNTDHIFDSLKYNIDNYIMYTSYPKKTIALEITQYY